MGRSQTGERLAYPVLLAFSLFLAITFQAQVKWFGNLPLHAQPGLWALISVAGMVVSSAILAIRAFLRPGEAGAGSELFFWIKACEYLIWFMAYVFIVPWLGYLPSTLLFCVGLSYRLGYRKAKWLWSSAGIGLATVILFRAVLKVQVPGGMVYEYLPQPFSSFMLTYL